MIWDDIATSLNLPRERGSALRKAVSRALRDASDDVGGADDAAPEPPEDTGGKAEITMLGEDRMVINYVGDGRVRTLDDLLASCNADLDVWAVERWKGNCWEVGAKQADGSIKPATLFQVTAHFIKRQEVFDFKQVVADMLADAAKYAPPRPVDSKGFNPASTTMLEICVFDSHIGKLAHAEETGEGYDTNRAVAAFEDAVTRLVQMADFYKPNRILLPLGNDLFHHDVSPGGSGSATTKGTVMDTDTRWPVLFARVRRMMVGIIDRLSEVAPVDVIMVPGNHDARTTFYLGEVLEAWYRNDESVQVDYRPRHRKYFQWGEVLLGFTHGNNEKHDKLPMLMATEAKIGWAQTTWREFHVGHIHTKRDVQYTATNEDAGVRIRAIPSLSAPDDWHSSRGYLGNQRCAESFIWDKVEGFVGNFSVSYREQNNG